MDDDPQIGPQKNPRRRFQFGLRTLMIVVTLLAVACAYVAWQAKIVVERKALRRHLQDRYNAGFNTLAEFTDRPPASVSWIRQFLGDEAVRLIELPPHEGDDEWPQIQAAFPEAMIRHWPEIRTAS